jgi:hypothetical protein
VGVKRVTPSRRFGERKILRLTGDAVECVVMLEAQPNQVLGPIVAGLLVEMRHLSLLHSFEAVEIEAEATSALTGNKKVGFDILWYGRSACHA